MADQDIGTPTSGGELRASHADRDQVVELLRVAAGDGRLSAEELDERLERALTARTYAELAALTADLPAAPGTALSPGSALSPTGLGTPSRQVKDLVRIECGSSRIQRVGGWVVPKRMDISVASGEVRLDFTQAVITQPVLLIDAEVRSGRLKIITKPGIVVDADEMSVRSGQVRVREPWGTDVPVLLRIEVAGSVRSGHVEAGPPRRTFWQWLRRAPRRYAIAG
jgi:hypothetical protein